MLLPHHGPHVRITTVVRNVRHFPEAGLASPYKWCYQWARTDQASIMAPLWTRSCASLLGRVTVFLSLVPWAVYATAPTVEVNGTSIIGTSQASLDNITVEFFGGK